MEQLSDAPLYLRHSTFTCITGNKKEEEFFFSTTFSLLKYEYLKLSKY